MSPRRRARWTCTAPCWAQRGRGWPRPCPRARARCRCARSCGGARASASCWCPPFGGTRPSTRTRRARAGLRAAAVPPCPPCRPQAHRAPAAARPTAARLPPRRSSPSRRCRPTAGRSPRSRRRPSTTTVRAGPRAPPPCAAPCPLPPPPPPRLHCHNTPPPPPGGEYQAEVGLLTRNVLFTSDAASESTGLGPHTTTLGPRVRVAGAAFERWGARNVPGRYSLHFHLVGDAPGAYVRDCAFYSTNWCGGREALGRAPCRAAAPVWAAVRGRHEAMGAAAATRCLRHPARRRCISIHATNDVEVSGNVAFDSEPRPPRTRPPRPPRALPAAPAPPAARAVRGPRPRPRRPSRPPPPSPPLPHRPPPHPPPPPPPPPPTPPPPRASPGPLLLPGGRRGGAQHVHAQPGRAHPPHQRGGQRRRAAGDGALVVADLLRPQRRGWAGAGVEAGAGAGGGRGGGGGGGGRGCWVTLGRGGAGPAAG